MAYGDVTRNASHRVSFDNDLTDSIGSANWSHGATATDFEATPITRDASQSLRSNGRDEICTAPIQADTGSVAQSRYAFQIWFTATQIQGPPCMIYSQGGNTSGIAIFLWAGNNIVVQLKNSSGNSDIQIFSDIALTNNRPYNFFVRFSGNGFSNEFEFYLDAVKQTANRNGVAPDTADLAAHTTAHTIGENGTSGTQINIGSESVLIKAPVNGRWAEWWTWDGADAEALTDSQILDDLFGAGAIPELTISADTEVNMQIALDAIADTVRGDVPLAILVEEVTGGGDLNLSADNITFNERSSLHVRYEGSGTLNWTNTNGSNATKSSGNVTFLNPAQLTLNNVDNPSEVRVYEAGTTNELAGQESVTTGTFSATISTTPVDIRVLSLTRQNLKFSNIDLSSDLTIDVQQFLDRQYENL